MLRPNPLPRCIPSFFIDNDKIDEFDETLDQHRFDKIDPTGCINNYRSKRHVHKDCLIFRLFKKIIKSATTLITTMFHGIALFFQFLRRSSY